MKKSNNITADYNEYQSKLDERRSNRERSEVNASTTEASSPKGTIVDRVFIGACIALVLVFVVVLLTSWMI